MLAFLGSSIILPRFFAYFFINGKSMNRKGSINIKNSSFLLGQLSYKFNIDSKSACRTFDISLQNLQSKAGSGLTIT